jgi:7-alpha-hydroxysteroid dehydrogenase
VKDIDTPSLFDLHDRAAIVTGAGRGIGAAIALALAGAGADLTLVARTRSQLDEVAELVEGHGRKALVLDGDVNDLEWLPEVVERTVSTFGHLDTVVNNAGGSRSYPILDTRVEHLESSFRFNVLAPFELVRLAVPHLLEREGASIINVSSNVWMSAPRGQLVHGTTKAAIAYMTRLMANDLAPRIRVNGILPGAVETEALRQWLETLPPEARDVMRQRVAMRRNGQPEDIAGAAVFLAGKASAWMTGELLKIDGMVLSEIVPKEIVDL